MVCRPVSHTLGPCLFVDQETTSLTILWICIDFLLNTLWKGKDLLLLLENPIYCLVLEWCLLNLIYVFSSIVQQVLGNDYSKMAFLCADRSVCLHAKYGSHYRLRIPRSFFCPFQWALLFVFVCLFLSWLYEVYHCLRLFIRNRSQVHNSNFFVSLGKHFVGLISPRASTFLLLCCII